MIDEVAGEMGVDAIMVAAVARALALHQCNMEPLRAVASAYRDAPIEDLDVFWLDDYCAGKVAVYESSDQGWARWLLRLDQRNLLRYSQGVLEHSRGKGLLGGE